jgi:branched-chain amino acid aminotransferase
VTTLCEDLGIDVVVDNLARSDVYIADEMFLVGTAAEVSSVNSVDDRDIPCPGPKTLAVADLYGRVVRGQVDKYRDWCELAG